MIGYWLNISLVQLIAAFLRWPNISLCSGPRWSNVSLFAEVQSYYDWTKLCSGESDSKFEQGHVSLFHTSFAHKIENRAIPNSLYTLQKFNKSNALPCNEVYAMLQRGFLTL